MNRIFLFPLKRFATISPHFSRRINLLAYFFHSSAPIDMRYSIHLCEEENDFRKKRKNVVFKAMRKLLGTRGPRTLDEVNIYIYFV